MATSFYLASEAKTLKSGDRPIIVAVHLNGVRVLTNIGYAISPDSWNGDTGFVKKGRSNSKNIAYNIINSRINSIKAAFQSLEAREASLSKEEILNIISNIKGGKKSEKANDLEMLREKYNLLKLYFDRIIRAWGHPSALKVLSLYNQYDTNQNKDRLIVTFSQIEKEIQTLEMEDQQLHQVLNELPISLE